MWGDLEQSQGGSGARQAGDGVQREGCLDIPQASSPQLPDEDETQRWGRKGWDGARRGSPNRPHPDSLGGPLFRAGLPLTRRRGR